jgi:hypothetical protein
MPTVKYRNHTDDFMPSATTIADEPVYAELSNLNSDLSLVIVTGIRDSFHLWLAYATDDPYAGTREFVSVEPVPFNHDGLPTRFSDYADALRAAIGLATQN